MKAKDMQEIYNNYTNGNRRDMVELIDEYCLYDFWADLRDFLGDHYDDDRQGIRNQRNDFQDICISYFRIKNR
jgi:hypothetical protein